MLAITYTSLIRRRAAPRRASILYILAATSSNTSQAHKGTAQKGEQAWHVLLAWLRQVQEVQARRALPICSRAAGRLSVLLLVTVVANTDVITQQLAWANLCRRRKRKRQQQLQRWRRR